MVQSLFQLPGRLALLLPLIGLWPAAADMAMVQERWMKLADRTVSYTVDHTEMSVDGIEKNLNGARLKVRKGAINLHRCTVHYNNGQTVNIDVLNSIPEGGESKLIEFSPTGQTVTRLVFTYDTKNRAIQKAEVELWGRSN